MVGGLSYSRGLPCGHQVVVRGLPTGADLSCPSCPRLNLAADLGRQAVPALPCHGPGLRAASPPADRHPEREHDAVCECPPRPPAQGSWWGAGGETVGVWSPLGFSH